MDLKDILYAVIGLVFSIGGFVMRNLFSEVATLKREVSTKTSEAEVRQILADKIEPLMYDVQELSAKLDKIYDFLIKKT